MDQEGQPQGPKAGWVARPDLSGWEDELEGERQPRESKNVEVGTPSFQVFKG